MSSEQTPREELVKVIHEQQARIRELEEALLRQEVSMSSLRRYNAHTDKWGPAPEGES